MRILAFGDSLVAGYGLGSELCWAGILAQDDALVNAGKNGSTASDSLSRFQNYSNYDFDLLILQFAINDMVAIAQERESLEMFLRSMDSYCAHYERVLVVGPHHIIDDAENFQSWFPHALTNNLDANTFLERMHEALEALCQKNNATYLNLYHDTIMQEKDMVQTPHDGFHFSEKGSRHVAMRMKEILK